MKFAMPIDDEARSTLPALAGTSPELELTDSHLSVRFGPLLQFEVPRAVVRGASLLPDPRPSVFLPPGVSAAVDKLGGDTISAIGSYQGLVRVDFNEPVEAQTRQASDTPGAGEPEGAKSNEGPVSGGPDSVRLQHLIVSVDDPEELVRALGAGARQQP